MILKRSYESIPSCSITQKDSNILKYFVDNQEDPRYKEYGGFHTGVDIECKEVYAPCSCVVTYIGNNTDERNVVIVQYDSHTSFRFCNLLDVRVGVGPIEVGTLIGIANTFVHFELLTREESRWVVRVGGQTHYKHDPYEYAVGNVTFENWAQQLVEYDLDPMLERRFEEEV